jgi:hypothetical protein
MAITDVYIANDVVYRVLENGSNDAAFPLLITNMFSSQEILDSMNRIQQQFLLMTGAIVTRTTIAASIGTPRYDMPTNSIRPRRLTWTDASDSKTRVLTQVDTWELDTGATNWPADRAIPIAWVENQLPQQTVQVAKTPDNDGIIGLLYVQLAATLDGTGVVLAIPDDWAPYITWGTLGELLSSDGPSYDPVRAQYCNRRFEEGIELARIVLGSTD